MDTSKVSKLKKAMKEKSRIVTTSVSEYKTLNEKLNSSLEVSLSIIIDLSKILKHYHDLLNAIEQFVDEPIDMADDVKTLAATAFEKMTASFNTQIDEVLETYDGESEHAKTLKDLRDKINKSFADGSNPEQGDEDDDESDQPGNRAPSSSSKSDKKKTRDTIRFTSGTEK